MKTESKVISKPVWKKINTHDIKYSYCTLTEFLTMIKIGVPEGTKDDDILLEVDASYSTTYYDEIIIDVDMSVSIKETK